MLFPYFPACLLILRFFFLLFLSLFAKDSNPGFERIFSISLYFQLAWIGSHDGWKNNIHTSTDHRAKNNRRAQLC